eukprot:6447928-Pyramimonas_sp.AAC.1
MQNIDREVGENEATVQAEATRIRADKDALHGDADSPDIDSSGYAGLLGERLSMTEIEGIGRSIAS